MKIQEQESTRQKDWKEKGYHLPRFNREEMIEKTKEAPFWLHFGPGNIFRAFQAHAVQKLLNEGKIDRGLIVAEGYDYEIIEKINRPCENYHILATLKANGQIEKTVVGSIAQSLTMDRKKIEDWKGLEKIFSKESLQIVSFTITEKGYALKDTKGVFFSAVMEDIERGPKKAESYMGKVASLLYHRYREEALPIAMVSMDNCSHNGERLKEAIETFAKSWCERGLAEEGFLAYVTTSEMVSFPWTMIDKITPRPDPTVKELLQADGLEGMEPIITEKKTYAAAFVNAEETEYLIVEDAFPNGRCKALEEGGILFTTRKVVEQVEKMKVCTCLNPLHTALAIFGCLLGYEKISEEMKDPELKKMVERIGYQEGMPVVVDPGILDPREFLDTVLQVRLPNPFMPDTPQRIATDTSQKLAIRFGETVKAYERAENRKVEDLEMVPLVYAGWLRYLMGVDDQGNTFACSPDPMLEAAREYVKEFTLQEGQKSEERLQNLLGNKTIWGVDLYEAGLAKKVVAYFEEMIKEPGGVRKTLRRYV